MDKSAFCQLTVLMAVYNGGSFLQKAVESVLLQTHKDFEFLIINDCSTDESLRIIESFSDHRIRIHTNEINFGQTASLNVGFKLARGQYIARIDADDVAFPNWLEEQVLFLKYHPGYAVVSANALVIDESNRIRKSFNPPANEQEIIFRSLIKSPINHVGSVMRKEIILENGGYDEGYKIAADYALWGKLLRNKREITTNNKMLMAIRMHAKSVSMIEKEAREEAEIAGIMQENINNFANAKFSNEEIKILYKAFYKTENLPDKEFTKAIGILKNISECLQYPAGFDRPAVCRWLKKQKLIAYFKRIFFYITLKNYVAVRKISLQGIKECGMVNILSGFFFASLLGSILLSKVLVFFDKLNCQHTSFYLVRKPGIKIFSEG